MQVIKAAKMTYRLGEKKHFTGTVQLDEITVKEFQADVKVYRVFFAPGARTYWHTHQEGQVLHIVAGMGRIGTLRESMIEVGPDDVAYICPGEKHWHGAAPERSMIHFATSPDNEGKDTGWGEEVTDDEYNGRVVRGVKP
ncbi:MAG: hypothetical protein AYP45_04660 [Candidatus Brocadia carolinensis]|uniref:Cupin type-2 domain-containing protein n=1 Tax=Candidatus Brocadia carolinensis TaxID=1004156 RepID=A0A1V4AVR4_9BACT|nr:MAG: hypothetical protein AYP45_04660 [Candidatus Brocadia caroliniensis]